MDSQQVITNNLQLIKKIAAKYCTEKEEFEDYVQVGAMAVHKGLPKYNKERGALSTFIWTTVRNAIFNYKRYHNKHNYMNQIDNDYIDTNVAMPKEQEENQYLNLLNNQERTIYDLYIWGDSPREIGVKLGYRTGFIRKKLGEIAECLCGY